MKNSRDSITLDVRHWFTRNGTRILVGVLLVSTFWLQSYLTFGRGMQFSRTSALVQSEMIDNVGPVKTIPPLRESAN